jgi:DNA-binding NtrC family response regulator
MSDIIETSYGGAGLKKILIVEDEEKIRNIYSKLLTEEGFAVIESSNVTDAYDAVVRDNIDLILLDIRMPEIEGNILYEILQFMRSKSKVLVASVYPIETQKRMIPDAAGYFDKSHGLDILLDKIRKILRHK